MRFTLKRWQMPVSRPGLPGKNHPTPTMDEFYLLTGKVGRHTQFATQNNQLLNKYQDEPGLWMNPEAAQELGLENNDLVEVTSEMGKINIILQVTEAIRPDCVYMTPGFGHLSKGLTTGYGVGASDSMLHVTYTDPISGGQALSQTFVTVKKIAGLPSGDAAQAAPRRRMNMTESNNHKYGFLIDASLCIDCRACLVACSVENNVPMDHTRIWINETGVKGKFPESGTLFSPLPLYALSGPILRFGLHRRRAASQ